MPDTSDVILTGIPTREQALASGFITREMVMDGIVLFADMKADTLWEEDPLMACWHKRTPDFIAARAETMAALVQQKKDAEIALAAAMISMEADLPLQHDGQPSAIASNNQPYASVASEVRKEGESYVGCATSAQAIAAWKRAVLEYAATHRGDVLWWRCRPKIDGGIPFGKTAARWIVYSRLMIGDLFSNQVKRGERVPTGWDIQDGLITEDEIAELGLVLDLGTNEYRPAPV